jgi:dihydroorotase
MRLTIIKPDDWHLHLRDGEVLTSVLPHTAKRFKRAIIMPNLKPPVTSVDMARAYRARILKALPARVDFEPLMTLYLTENMPTHEIKRARESGIIHGVKLYPAGATMHSEAGVRQIDKVYRLLEAMQEHGLVLEVHGEVVDAEIDVFDRERVFIERVLASLHNRYPALKIVFEHITTQAAVQFVSATSATVAATITPQHLLFNRNGLFAGGLRPHHFCLPVLKRERDRQAIIQAATSGDPKFFLGTDSAPHPKNVKESACGCAGIFSAHAAIELYAEAFEAANELNKLEGFASRYGAQFYDLPINTGSIMLVRENWQVPVEYPLGNNAVIPIRAGETMHWRLAN